MANLHGFKMGLSLTTFWLGWSSKQHFHDSWRSICCSSSHNHGSMEKWGSGRWVLSTRSFSTFIVVGKKVLDTTTFTFKPQTSLNNPQSCNIKIINKLKNPFPSMLVKTCFMSANKKVTTVPSNSRFPVQFGLLRQQAIASQTHRELPQRGHVENLSFSNPFPTRWAPTLPLINGVRNSFK